MGGERKPTAYTGNKGTSKAKTGAWGTAVAERQPSHHPHHALSYPLVRATVCDHDRKKSVFSAKSNLGT